MRKLTRRRSLAGGVGLLLGALVLAGCGGGTSTAGPTITLYSGQHEETTDALVKAFEASRPAST